MSSPFVKTPFFSPVVTVVMPAYNHARYIVDALNSVRSQTFASWELIVIDDGSTDTTWAVLNDYVASVADPRIQIFTQTNLGSHATLNRGLSMAKSPYLAILNSDDSYLPERLQHLVQVGDSVGGEVFISTGVRLIDQNGAPIIDSHWWQGMYRDLIKHWHSMETQFDNPAVQALLWGNFTVSTSNFFFSRNIFEQVGLFKHLQYVPDWDYALRAASEHPDAFVFLPADKLLNYRLHGRNTILGGALRNHAEAFRVLRIFQKKWVDSGHKISGHAVDRLHYLARFMRHEHARQLLEEQKVGWVEQVNAVKTEVDRSRVETAHHQQQTAHYQQQTAHYQEQAQRNHEQAVQFQKQVAEYQEQAQRNQEQAAQYQEQVKGLRASHSWKLTAPLRKMGLTFRRMRKVSRTVAAMVISRFRRRLNVPSTYDDWLSKETIALSSLRAQKNQILEGLTKKPLMSIVIPVHDTPVAFLQAAVDSVNQQWYDRWELCICNDGSKRPDTLKLLDQLEKSDSRIKVTHRAQAGHIALASNDAIAMAQGDYIVFLDHDDKLAAHALLRLTQTLAARPELDFIYSDEDKIDSKGRRSLPFFKPDWSPVLLWSQNYIGHLMCIRRSLLLELGGFKPGTHGSQDHDLMLRMAAHGATITHLSEVLYHWRMHPASTSSSPEAKPYAHIAGKEAVTRHLSERYGAQFNRVDDSEYAFVYQPRFNVPAGTTASIIIPTRDHAELLRDCIDSIRQLTQGINYEIIVLDNGSQESATHSYFATLDSETRIKVISADMPFNWSRLNNMGRQHAKGQVLVFLNNDTKVISSDWLLRLVEHALLPDVATIGPMLLYPDGTIQHAGVVVGMGGWADHVFKGEPVTHFPSPFVSSVLPRNVLANTGACVAIATQRLDQLGGFDEAFQICGSDVELGIRAHNQGYHNVYLPDVRLYHLESKTRSSHVPAVDFEQSALKYAPFRLEGDPFYNPNLDLSCAKPTPRFPARLAVICN
jgi:glycosyltransferase involved in cell wall biosynthesis